MPKLVGNEPPACPGRRGRQHAGEARSQQAGAAACHQGHGSRDGDGLSDNQEWWRGCGLASTFGATTTDDLTDGYANDSDSDADGYIDGEDNDPDVATASGIVEER